jgi:GNAT superfamily N-acetyltransferase
MVEIRVANRSDSERIAVFQVEMAMETEGMTLDPEVVSRGVEAVFSDPKRGTYFVARTEGETVGSMLVTHEWSDWRNGNIWWLQSVYILPAFRRKKIFSKMYSYLRKKVEEDENLLGIRLYVDKTNTAARKVYERLGMDGDHYLTYEWIP